MFHQVWFFREQFVTELTLVLTLLWFVTKLTFVLIMGARHLLLRTRDLRGLRHLHRDVLMELCHIFYLL